MFRTSDDVLNLVVAWANTVQRVWSYPNTIEDSNVCTFLQSNGSLCDIQAHNVHDWLKAVVTLIGKAVLGFEAEDIGLHSIHSRGSYGHVFVKSINHNYYASRTMVK